MRPLAGPLERISNVRLMPTPCPFFVGRISESVTTASYVPDGIASREVVSISAALNLSCAIVVFSFFLGWGSGAT